MRAWGILVGLALVASAVTQNEYGPSPKLVVDGSSAFDCGVWPRASYGRHPWTIRNTGRETLTLRIRFTSGRSGFSLWQDRRHSLAPGEEIVVWMTWLTPTGGDRPFSSYATVWTNDPSLPVCRFRVFGQSGPVSPETTEPR